MAKGEKVSNATIELFKKNYIHKGKKWCLENLEIREPQIRYLASKFKLKSLFKFNDESNKKRGSAFRGKKRPEHSAFLKRLGDNGMHPLQLNPLLVTKHGLSTTRGHIIWKAMLRRCYDQNCPSYKNYGGRGITVCDEWKMDTKVFCEWYNQKYKPLTNCILDRIDPNGNYCPDNCRMVSHRESANNRRNTVYFEGIPLTIYADSINIKEDTLRKRIKRKESKL